MTRSIPPTLRLFRSKKRRRVQPPIQSVHVALSKSQRAYSVFMPPSDDVFPLFKVVSILSNPAERSNSPFDTVVNLKDTFERLNDIQHMHSGEDKTVIDAFIREFNATSRNEPEQTRRQFVTVSEESLWNASLNVSTPTGLLSGVSVSRSRAATRQIRLQHHFSEAYRGGAKLQTLIWNHAKPLFHLILEELHHGDNFPSARLERGLLAIVTTRMVATIGISRSAEIAASAGVSLGVEAETLGIKLGGNSRRRIEEEYNDLYGVSGLHFIVFPIECSEENLWRIYRGINVCNSDISDDDESFSESTRNQNGFYRAQKWVLGEAELIHGSDPTTVQRPRSTHMRMLSPFEDTPDVISGFAEKKDDDAVTSRQNFLGYVVVSRRNISVPWVVVDIRPCLNEFAQRQCRLASYYRKTALGDSEKLTHSIHLLRSALRKYCFESTVRALYDLSGCYLLGTGVTFDFGMAKLLRYYASDLRRNYIYRDTRLRRLALEVTSFPQIPIERTIVSLTLYSRPTLTSLVPDLDNSNAGDSVTETALSSGLTQEDDRNPTCLFPSTRCHPRNSRNEGSPIPEDVHVDASQVKELDKDVIKESRVVVATYTMVVKDRDTRICMDAVRERKLYEREIKKGHDVERMYNLAVLLQDGAEGFNMDAVRAKELYERVIKEGHHVKAMYNLALLLEDGAEGVDSDTVRAKELYERAVEEGHHVKAMYNLALLLQDGTEGVGMDAVRAKELYEQAIMEGHDVKAMYNLAMLLQNGAEGVDSDTIRAKELYERAIMEGHDVKAMNNLAMLLQDGADGVTSDAVRAKELYEQAIEEGHYVKAMYNLAMLLQDGADGVASDAVRAKELYERAIEEGHHVDAMNNLALLLENGAEGVVMDAVRAKELYERAIKEGHHVKAMYNLASLLENGAEGVDTDVVRARELYQHEVK